MAETKWIEAYGFPYLSIQEQADLLSVAAATFKIKQLKIPNKIRPTLRPQMHCLMSGKIGTAKTQMITDLKDHANIIPMSGLTSATLFGTVDKQTQQFIEPAIWAAKNAGLFIDEITTGFPPNGKASPQATMLSLLESPVFTKPFAYKCYDRQKREDEDLYCFIDDQNRLHLKTRFCFFGTTMDNMFFHKPSNFKLAWKSRCVIIPHYPTNQEMKDCAKGKMVFKFRKYSPDTEHTITKKTYASILSMADTALDAKMEQYKYLRTVGDLCRIHQVTGNSKAFNHNASLLMRIREFQDQIYKPKKKE